ncbi:MAG: hypothetical protein Q8R48_07620 [Candidatus Omnitrophota bacterium]|nr:hypothetical protein [Candidatus Omnitrophota bacterium]
MKNKAAYNAIIIAVIFGLLNLSMPVLTFAQDTQAANEDLTKYTVRQYLEANLPPQDGRKIILDEITGLLTITDTPTNQELALRLIREWDIGPKQIEIEAKFVEITFTDLDEMGVDWDIFHHDEPLIYSPDSSLFDATKSGSVVGLMGTASTAAQFSQAATTAGLGFLISKTAYHGAEMLAYLKLLAQKGKANLIHAPKITTLSGQMANLQVVRSFPYATSVETTQVEIGSTTSAITGVTETDYVNVETYKVEEEIVGVTLEVTPTVMEGSDIITLDLHPEVTKLSQQIALTANPTTDFPDDLGWPIIDTRTAQTSVMVRSGDSILIGGLIQDADDGTVKRKVPILGDLPLVGALFKYEYQKREKKNLIVVLTARLIDTQGEEVKQ